jgi:hypothetical protein
VSNTSLSFHILNFSKRLHAPQNIQGSPFTGSAANSLTTQPSYTRTSNVHTPHPQKLHSLPPPAHRNPTHNLYPCTQHIRPLPPIVDTTNPMARTCISYPAPSLLSSTPTANPTTSLPSPFTLLANNRQVYVHFGVDTIVLTVRILLSTFLK